MPLTRPVAGDPVVVEDFGQPVYDKLIFGEGYAFGNMTNTTLATPNTNYVVPLFNRVTGDANSWDISQSDGSLVCKRAGVYFCICTAILSGFGGAPSGTYWGCGIKVNGTDKISLVGGVGKFWDNAVNSGLLTLAVNDKVTVTAGTDMASSAIDNRGSVSLVPIKG